MPPGHPAPLPLRRPDLECQRVRFLDGSSHAGIHIISTAGKIVPKQANRHLMILDDFEAAPGAGEFRAVRKSPRVPLGRQVHRFCNPGPVGYGDMGNFNTTGTGMAQSKGPVVMPVIPDGKGNAAHEIGQKFPRQIFPLPIGVACPMPLGSLYISHMMPLPRKVVTAVAAHVAKACRAADVVGNSPCWYSGLP